MSQSTATGCFCGGETFGLMIECDKCHSEYHGTCIKITEAIAMRISKYTCAKCSNKKNGTDEIVYSAANEDAQPCEPVTPLRGANRGRKFERKSMSGGDASTPSANTGTLFHRGFKFYRHYVASDKSKVHYTCSQLKSHGCLCRVYKLMATGDVVDHRGQHNHPPNETGADAVKRWNSINNYESTAKHDSNAKVESTPFAKPGAALIRHGFKYFRHAFSADKTTIFWRCSLQQPDGCNARVHISIATGNVIEQIGQHNHPPPEPYKDIKNAVTDNLSKGHNPNKRRASAVSSNENAVKKPRVYVDGNRFVDGGRPPSASMGAASSPLSVVQRLIGLPSTQRANATKLFNSLLDEMDDAQ